MRVQVLHTTEYRYPEDAVDSFNEIRLQPCDNDRQSVVDFALEVTITTRHDRTERIPSVSRRDYYGTTVSHAHARDAHRVLTFKARSTVLTHPAPDLGLTPAYALEPHLHRQYEYLATSGRVPLELDWLSLLRWRTPEPDEDLVKHLDALTAHLHSRFTYETGATHVHTPLRDFVESGRGVCQDYAHAMLAVCRKAGIPARYTSGYIDAGSNFVGAEATHAWVECFVPDFGWVGFDPTNCTRAGEAHVKIGHGRDYDDVPPIRGLRRGGGVEAVGVDVTVDTQQ
jgi:transglutaminase-like putative cysteine protease